MTTVHVIVNGRGRQAKADANEWIGVVALRALLDEGYDWTTVELRGSAGALIPRPARASRTSRARSG
jgi:hypothetical protein